MLTEANPFRVRACFFGVIAISMLWTAAVSAAVPMARDVPPQRWDRLTATALLAYIETLDRHGLDPVDYEPSELRRAIAAGDPAALERQASESFGLAARDLATGHVRPAQRQRYHIATEPLQADRIARLIDQAIASRNVAGVLEALAPRSEQYRALRHALARLPEERATERRKLEVNLERWRWLPRQMGTRHIRVNVPEYRLRLMHDGEEISSHRIIVGTRRTPTPLFSAQVTAVILNPPWNVPQSIVAESVGGLVRNSPSAARARGYVWSRDGNGRLSVTQRPGPGNSLGQMKLDMPNSFSVFVHDTPSKALFEEEVRTFSHGCIRTEAPFDLGEALLANSGWTRAMIDETVKGRQTTRVALDSPVPIYVVYLTAYAAPDGGVRYFDDPYGLDAGIAAHL